MRFAPPKPDARELSFEIGLFPFVVLDSVTRGVQSLQQVAPARIGERPHAGPLNYEKRKLFTWDQMAQAISAWRATHL